MAWIKVIPPEGATGELAEFYKTQRASADHRRRLWHLTEADAGETGSADWANNPVHGNLLSLNAAAARAYQAFSQIVNYGEGPLSQAQRQMIATVVSAANHCVY
jgi:alkylhydroperoxidase family enzyme